MLGWSHELGRWKLEGGVVRQTLGSCSEDEARGVPDLVGEVASAVEVRLAESLVGARGRAVHEREAQRVGTDLVHDRERVDDVALRLRHLAAVRVAHEPGEVDDRERRSGR